jgi:quercetin dioxygenase-like cupin family protein
MARYSYPHTIENGAGERITFVCRVASPAGERLLVENAVSPGAGPPMHTHHYQTEALTVVQSRIGYQRLGQAPRYGGPGDTLTLKPGEPQKFWNAWESELRCSGYIEPPDNVEYFLTELYASTKRNGGRRPDAFDAEYLIRRYRSEFSMQEIPAAVQRVLFPVQAAIGRLLGKYARYADAPEPIER